jgi:hypothetical protein
MPRLPVRQLQESAEAVMKQRWLPEFDYPDLGEPTFVPDVADDRATADVSTAVMVLPGQQALFTAERELIGQIEAACASGRFEEVRGCCEALLALEGPSELTREVSAADEITDIGFWERPLRLILDDWPVMQRRLHDLPNLGGLIREGMLSRLIEHDRPAEIVRADPRMLPPLVNRLCAATRAGDPIPDAAAALVRDALADWHRPEPHEFTHNELADLLAEEDGPAWLACLGALRHIWAVPPMAPPERTEPISFDTADEEERGARFWECLRIAASCTPDHPAAADARKRMKQLHPERHAWYMRSGVRREAG